MLKIKYVPVENCEAEWGDKMALIKRFEGLKLKTLGLYYHHPNIFHIHNLLESKLRNGLVFIFNAKEKKDDNNNK